MGLITHLEISVWVSITIDIIMEPNSDGRIRGRRSKRGGRRYERARRWETGRRLIIGKIQIDH